MEYDNIHYGASQTILKLINDINTLYNDINNFKNYAIRHNWFPNQIDFESEIRNKRYFECNIENRIKTLLCGMDKRPQAVEEHSQYLIEDDKWAKKEYKEILVTFEQFRNKMQIGKIIE